MKSLKVLESTDLTWRSKGWLKSARHELINRHGEIVARVNHLSFWNNDVEVDAPGNRWTFARRGQFSGRHVQIRSLATGEQIATYYYRMTKPGLLEFEDGRTYTWERGNLWGSQWAWLDAEEKPLVGFSQYGTFQLSSGVHLGEGAEDDRSLPLLIFLGWYLVLLNTQDSSG